MAISLVKIGDDDNIHAHEYVIDSASDFSNLPTNAPMGSTAIQISPRKFYICNSEGTWVEI